MVQDHDLGIHIRAGDIFSSTPHPEYYQPPLAFYLAAVQRHLALFPSAHIWIVHEDMGNPVIAALIQYCQRHHIPSTSQSACLRQDLSLLFALRHLVFSRGSFGFCIASLSQRLQTAYTFDGWMPPFDGQVVHIHDLHDAYVAAVHPWTNSAAQRELMLQYPQSALIITE